MKRLFVFVLAFLPLCLSSIPAFDPATPELFYYGHSCFMLITTKFVKIVMDPHSKFKYPLPEKEADIVTISHEHFDHSNAEGIKGKPVVLRGLKSDGSWNQINTTIKGVHIFNIGTYHDEENGTKRGRNSIFVFDLDERRFVHLGDLGHLLSKDIIKKLGKVDVLMIPVGGYYTIDAVQATQLAREINAKVVVPMHYQTEITKELPIKPLDVFLENNKDVRARFMQGNGTPFIYMPFQQEIWVLKYPYAH